ncbi:MAG: uroporphyrinogen-III synthase [Gemmataceae bacterium]|nr:uroporphyrinogen-III synthase [Gemmataceae bacterium]
MGTAPEASINWSRLATATDTLVLAWAAGNLPTVTRLLIDHGRDPSTPVAVVAWGAEVRQQTVVGTLSDIADLVAEADLQSPAITVVGDVVRLRDRLRWYDDRPLFGRRVLVTRTRHGASEIRRLLQAEGAEVIELPTHDVVDAVVPELFDRVVQALDEERYGWLIFSSPRAVELFFRHLHDLGRDSRALHSSKVATVGLPTAEALAEHGIVADVAIELPSTDAILARLPQRELARRRVLLPRAEESQHDLLRALRRLGAEVEDVPMFVSAVRLAPDRDALAKLRRHEIDAVVFPASSAVTSLVRMLGGDVAALQSVRVACIGPITAEVALQAGLRVDTVADPPTPAGVVKALARAMRQTPATA